MFAKLKAALLAKLSSLEQQVEADVTSPAGRIAAEKQLQALIAEIQPFATDINPAFGAALSEASALLGKAEQVEQVTGL